MNELEKPLMQGYSINTPWCVFCGKRKTQEHHVVLRSHGGTNGPTISVCGLGNASGCHGKLHSHQLHLRWVGYWEYLETDEPTKYQDALAMGGWVKL